MIIVKTPEAVFWRAVAILASKLGVSRLAQNTPILLGWGLSVQNGIQKLLSVWKPLSHVFILGLETVIRLPLGRIAYNPYPLAWPRSDVIFGFHLDMDFWIIYFHMVLSTR